MAGYSIVCFRIGILIENLRYKASRSGDELILVVPKGGAFYNIEGHIGRHRG